jgi:hypothetical protein
MPWTVREIQPTPNPNAVKFVLDQSVSDQPISFFNPDAARTYPLASKLFQVEGVSSLLLLGDFITVNKRPDIDWRDITPRVREILASM